MALLSAIILICIRIISLPFSIKSWIYTILAGPKPIANTWKRHAEQLGPYKVNILLRLCLFLTHIADHLKTIESNILRATDRELLEFRSRQMAQCSMTGVAAALVAQVASTTLGLQYMPTIHWIVPALCTSTIIIALLSMYNSFVLHDYLTGFACPADLRTEFSYQGDKNREGDPKKRGDVEEEAQAGPKVDMIVEMGVGASKKQGGLPCYNAAMKLWGPNYLLELAILLYVATIWVYWAIAWRMNLEGSGVRSRNVFIFSLLTSVLVPRKFGGGMGLGRALSSQPIGRG